MRLPMARAELARDRGPCARSSGRRCSGGRRAGRAPGRPRSGRRRGSARQVPQWSTSGASGSSSSVGQDGAEEQPGAELARRPGWCACPASRARPPAASGFSISGAVSTKTLTCAAERALQPAGQLLQPALEHVVVVAVAGVDARWQPRSRPQLGQRIAAGAVVHAQQTMAVRASGHMRSGEARRSGSRASQSIVPWWPARQRGAVAGAGLRRQAGARQAARGRSRGGRRARGAPRRHRPPALAGVSRGRGCCRSRSRQRRSPGW